MLQSASMRARLNDLLETTRSFARDFDPEASSGPEAVHAVEALSEMHNLIDAVRTVAAARVQATRAWCDSGATSAAAWLAARAGITVTAAAATIETASHLGEMPRTKAELLAGRLSSAQASEIVPAALADPDAEEELLTLARGENLARLRERCRDVRTAAVGDEGAAERIRQGRYLRHWCDRDGALRLDARLAPDDGAPLIAAIRARADEFERDARRAGHSERLGALAADALCSLVDGAGAPKAVVHVIVSKDAVERGHTKAGDTCRIDGVGPIPVEAARWLATRGQIKVIERTGINVDRVTHLGRTIPAHIRSALEVRDPTCVVPGCTRRRGLEIDHIVPFARGGATRLDNLARLCRFHHAQKTHHGWRLEGGPGSWTWTRRRPPARSP